MNFLSGRIAAVAVRATTLRRAAVLCLIGVLLVGQASGLFGAPLSAETAGTKAGAVAAAATVKSANPMASFPVGMSGDYVYYRDYSWKSPTWVGFLYYDDSTYGAVVVTPATGTNVSVLFRVETVDGKMILTGQNVVSKVEQKDVLAVNYLMGLLPDMYGWRMSAAGTGPKAGTVIAGKSVNGRTGDFAIGNRSLLLPPAVRQDLVVAGFGGAVSVVYLPEVPLFHLLEIDGADGKPVLELARMGRLQAGEDKLFFDFKPVPEAKDGVAFKTAPTLKPEPKTVDGITLKLDDQWTTVADNTFFLGDTAVLIVDTIDLSLLGIPQDNLPLSLTRFFSLSSKASWAVPAAFSLTGKTERFRIENRFYDSGTGTFNRDIKICIPQTGKKCTIISLSVQDTAYASNPAYFNSLVQ